MTFVSQMFCKLPILVSGLLTACLAATAVIGDHLVNYSTVHLHKAFFDNGTHAVVAVISWLIVCVCCKYKSTSQICIESITCGIIASLIDLDHFLVARALNLKVRIYFLCKIFYVFIFQAATNLRGRPPLHCTTVPLLICTSLYLLGSLLHIQFLNRVSLLIFTAFLSHHIRDANRRGFWLYPLGSTQSLSKFFYLSFTCLLPHLVCFLKQNMDAGSTNMNYKEIIV